MIAWARRQLADFVRRSVPVGLYRQWRGSFAAMTDSGVTVNESTALKLGAVFASIRAISETRGSLPIRLYEIKKSGKRAVVHQHPVAQMFATQANEWMTPMVCEETATSHVLGWGNSYSEITFDRVGVPIERAPIAPWSVTPSLNSSGELIYVVRGEDGTPSRTLDRSQVLHVPGIGSNGIVGWSPIKLFAHSIGIGLAQDQMAGTYFGNKAKPGIVVESPGIMTDEEYARLRLELDSQYSGANAFRALLLEGGLKATPITIPMNEAQFLESRNFQGEEIACRCFRLPPHVVGYLNKATFNNIESQDLYFEKHTMRPWLVRFEQEMNRKLFSRSEWGRFYLKHNVDALLRADIKTRYEAHKMAILSGWKSRNEVRVLEDLDPVEGLDELPLPEAIFGKGADGPKDTSQPRQTDPRLRALTDQVVRGLVQRERVAITRAASRSDWQREIRDFYEKHLPMLQERLQPLRSDLTPVMAAARSRRDQLLEASPGELAGMVAGWDHQEIVDSLLKE